MNNGEEERELHRQKGIFERANRLQRASESRAQRAVSLNPEFPTA